MYSPEHKRLPEIMNYKLVMADNVTMAFDSLKICMMPNAPVIKRKMFMPSFIVGMDATLNIPVVDIFALFNLKWLTSSKPSVYIKAELSNGPYSSNKFSFGFMVDKYIGNQKLETSKIKLFSQEDGGELSGITNHKGTTICILDIENLFSREQLQEIKSFFLISENLN